MSHVLKKRVVSRWKREYPWRSEAHFARATAKDGRTLELVGNSITADRAFITWAIVSTVKCSAKATTEASIGSVCGKTSIETEKRHPKKAADVKSAAFCR